MKKLFIAGGMGALLLAGASMAIAQDDHRNDRQGNAQQENRRDQARPEDRRNQQPESGNRRETTPQNEGRPEQQPQSGDRHPQTQENNRQMQPQERQNQERQNEDRQNNNRMERPQKREEDRQYRARPQGGEQGRAERRGGNERRIPDSDFRAHFGREHHFAPGRMQVYEGHPRFSYGGYLFELAQPWPSDWAYDQDDCYVDYMDGDYWLFNTDYPGVRILLTIVG